MTRFAFIIHPISARDVARKYPIAKIAPDKLIEFILPRMSPKIASFIDGIKALNGAETEGWFIGCPLTPHQMLTMPEPEVYEKIGQCCNIAAELGAKIIGLGAFTAVVGDGGLTIAKHSPIAVTTGNSYTVATSIQGVIKGCEMVGINLPEAKLAVVGATGSIGKTCAKMLAPQFGQTILIGRNLEKTQHVASEIEGAIASTDLDLLRDVDAIVTVTSSDSSVIQPNHLKPGAVVCDVARPRDVSKRVAKERQDVLVIEGGVVEVPGEPNFRFNFGFPPKMAYACMSETMMLALENRPENYTLGKDVTVKQVEEMIEMADRLGFKLSGFRSFEKAVSQEAIDRARRARQSLRPSPRTPVTQ
ncbi:MAG: shikimate dehydrogenase [Armatimonadetes bacterium]|nr:shikimate dehydrogenase [Armatimonadota bacterium]